MSTQTGSISFEATGGFNSYAKQNYATLSQMKGQFATCGTGASTAAKVATIVPTDSGWTLYDGATITVKFTSENTTTAPTLNVNGTGAKPIKDFNGNDLTKAAYEWPEGAAMSFTYDGTSWRLQDSNLMERVHSAETAIEQNANEISLRATKEEVSSAIDDIKITESGEGTSVIIEDSAGLPPIEITGKGWAEQASTTGKNLLPNTATSQTINGVTFTVNADGSVTANGTATEATFFNIPNSTGFELQAGTYTLSGTPSGHSYNAYMRVRNIDSASYVADDIGSGATFTLDADTRIYAFIRIAAGYTISNLVFRPQLESGSTATSYEPYSGAKPSPSPEYAQEIKVCRGRNLLDASDAFASYSPTYYSTNSDGSIVIARNDDRAWSALPVLLDLKAGTYTISRTNVSGGLAIRTSLDNYAADISINGNVGSMTFTLVSDCSIKMKAGYNAGAYPITTFIQLELGSTPTPYVPYGHVGLEVQGRNLFDEVTELGAIVDGANVSSASTIRSKNYTPVLPSTSYYLKSPKVTTTHFYDENKNFISKSSARNEPYQTPSNCRYVRFGFGSTYGATYNHDVCFSLSDTTRNGAYEPYHHETRAIPLPLKSDGERWAGGLPDGTADALSVDSAGRWEWTDTTAFLDIPIAELNGDTYPTVSASGARAIVGAGINATWPAYNAMGSIGSSSSVIIGFNTLGSNDGTVLPKAYYGMGATEWKERFPNLVARFLLPLATPTTESGYIDLPDLPSGARVSIPELEKSNIKVSWWTKSGQEAGTAHQSSVKENAELRIAADGITSEVSKISSVKYLNTGYNYTIGQIKTFSTEGYSGTWTIASNSDIRIGDTVYYKVTDTTRSCPVYIKATVTKVNSNTSITSTSHGYEDILPVETIKSTINQSADSVKIAANHVDIEGAAIFKSGGAYNTSTTVVSTQTQWYSSTSSTVKTNGEWTTTQPNINAGRYIWQRELVTYADGHTEYKPSEVGVCIQGQTDLSSYSTTTQMNSAINDAVDAVEIGGRNLLLQSRIFGRAEEQTRMVGKYNNNELLVEREDGFNEVQANADFRGISVYVDSMGFAVGDKLVFSTNVRSDSTVGTNLIFYCMAFNSSGTRIQAALLHLKTRAAQRDAAEANIYANNSFQAGAEERIVVEITWLQAAQDLLDAGGNMRFTIQAVSPDWSKGNVAMWAPKLEKGNRATDWTPAPEDVQSDLDNLSNALGGFDILWNRAEFGSDTSAGGECYLCALDPLTNQRSDADGWAMWNGIKRTITKGAFNPNKVLPYNIPIYIVYRLSSATATTGTNYMVWYNSGWKYAAMAPSTIGGTWTWAETTDMVLGKFVEPGSDVAFTECETYNPPRKWGAITSSIITAAGAQNTANNAAPKTSAVSRTQRIYFQSTSTTPPATPGTESSNWVSDESGVANVWTLKRMSYSSTHPYIYTCEQKQVVSGTVSYTPVLLDDTTTVIDGGKIITGSVTANALNASNINASNLLTIGAFDSDTQSDILNSNISVGGRNLLRNTAVVRSGVASKYGIWDILVPTYNFKLDLDEGEYILSFDWEADSVLPDSFGVWVGYGNGGGGMADMPGSLPNTPYGKNESSGHVERKFTWPDANDTYPYFACRPIRAHVDDSLNGITFTIKNAKLERGNKATDWTPAPEDVDSTISNISSFKILQSNYTNPLATIQNWAKEGTNAGNWDVTSTVNVRINDTVYIKTAPSDCTLPVYVILTVTAVNSATRLHGISHGYIDGNATNTANNAAPKTSAVSRTQRIYYRTSTALTNSITGPTTWISESGNKYNTTAPTIAITGWSTKPTPLAASTASDADKYLYLYTCTQTQTVAQAANSGTTCTASTILLDDTETIIDGGKIITGSVTANALNASNINASKTLTIGAFQESTQNDILNSNIQVGGRNLLTKIQLAPSSWTHTIANTTTMTGDGYENTWTMVKTGAWEHCYIAVSVTNGTKYTLSLDHQVLTAFDLYQTARPFVFQVCKAVPTSGDNYANVIASIPIGNTVSSKTRGSCTFTAVGDTIWLNIPGGYVKDGSTNISFKFSNVKLEEGNIATSWLPAPEDTDAAIDTAVKSVAQNWFATCSTAAGTKDKIATITPATTDFQLKAGVTVNVKFTVNNSYSATAANPITLNVNGSGAKNIYYANSATPTGTNTTAFGRANYTNTYVYDGTHWVWVSSSADNNNDTYNRVRWQNAIKVLAKPTGTWRILCGTSAGYTQIAKGVSFDLSYPILTLSNQPEAGATTDAAYTCVNSMTFTNTAAIESGTANSVIYLKGKVSGNIFTIDSTTVFTCKIPTSADGCFYIPLGIMYSATAGYFQSSKDLYAYIDGKFRQVTPTEIVATHRIYYRTTAINNSLAAPSTWVDEATANVYNTWTTKVPPLANGTNNSTTGYTKYPYLYTCEQRKRLDGTIECTKVLLDESTTVIDGGNIITGSIAANKLDVYDANIQKIKADAIDVSSINIGDLAGEIGGKNLGKTTGAEITPNDYNALKFYLSEPLESGCQYVIQLWDVDVSHTGKTADDLGVMVYYCGSNVSFGGWKGTDYFTNGHADHLKLFFTPYDSKIADSVGGNITPGAKLSHSTVTGTADSNKCIWLFNSVPSASGTRNMTVGKWKLEKGNKATDWSPAPEDVDSAIDDASKVADNYIHADSNGINIYDSSLTNASKYYLRQTAGGTYIYRNSYLKAKYEDTITLYGGSNASGANPKVELSSTAFNMYDSNGKKRTAIDTSGLTVYDTNANNIANFGTNVGTTGTTAFARIGLSNSTRFEISPTTLSAYTGTTKYFEVSASGLKYGANLGNTVATTTQVNDAAKTATNYMSYDSTNGLKIASASPASAKQRIQISSSKISMFGLDDKERLSLTTDTSGTSTITVGRSDQGHIGITNDGMTIYGASGTDIGSFATTTADSETTYVRVGPSTGSRAIIKSTGMEIYKDTTSVASFGDTVRIGKSGDSFSYMTLDFNSLKMLDKEGNKYLHISDLRNSDGYATMTEYFYPTTDTKTFFVQNNVKNNTIPTVEVNDSPATVSSVSYDRITLSSNVAQGSIVTIVYQTVAPVKAYTFGIRKADSIIGNYSFSEGRYTVASGTNSHAEGNHTTASGSHSHAEGNYTVASGDYSHAEGSNTVASGISHAEGYETVANGYCSHAEGFYTTAGYYSHAEGHNTNASGTNSHAEGYNTVASGACSHAEGSNTTASGDYSHAEGSDTVASWNYSHAEGYNTTANGVCSHAEGWNTVANSTCSHAKGYNTVASGSFSHATGYETIASGNHSYAGGQGTIAASESQTVIGRYNIEDVEKKYLFIIGNGSVTARSNALTVDQSGGIVSGGYIDIGTSNINQSVIPSSDKWGNGVRLKDTNGAVLGYFTVAKRASTGRVDITLRSQNGNNEQNSLNISIAPDNTCTYSLSNPTNFRAAIGAAASSDYRLKSDISLLDEDAVNFIRKLKPSVYTINGKRQVGLIAQDVYEADLWKTDMAFETQEGVDGLDDWEKMNDGSPTWKLDYIRLIAPTITALQKALERIEKLEAKVETLENK